MKIKKIIAIIIVFMLSNGLFSACINNENEGTTGLSFQQITSQDFSIDNPPLVLIGYSVSRGRASNENIIIPSSHRGLPVIAIASGGFQDFAIMTSVIIPSSIEYIGDDAFRGCTSLTNVTIPNSVIGIYSSAFRDCTNLTEIKIPKSVTTITSWAFENSGIWNNTSDNSVVYADNWAVGYKGTLSDIILKPGTVGLAMDTFRKSSLANISMSDSMTTIGWAAFLEVDTLTSIVLSDSLTFVDGHAFTGCDKLTIYAEFTNQPSSWYSDEYDWTYAKRPVILGANLSIDKTFVVSFTRNANSIENYNAINGISAPFRAGYIFDGWSVTENGTTVDFSATDVHNATNGTTLYAIWKEI